MSSIPSTRLHSQASGRVHRRAAQQQWVHGGHLQSRPVASVCQPALQLLPYHLQHPVAASHAHATQIQAQPIYQQSYVEYCDGAGDEELGWRTDFGAHFVQQRLLGTGSFGSVYSGLDVHTGKEVAIKVLPKVRGKLTREKTLEKLAREVDILERLQGCPGVVVLEEVFEDQDTVRIVTEVCSGGDLQKWSEANGSLCEASLAAVAHEVLKIVKACHSAGLLHGDVKPANFCLKHASRHPLASNPRSIQQHQHHGNNWLKAIDFGCSQLLPSSRRLSKRTGTPVYMAPEIYDRDYHAEADMWSVGVMLYQLFARRFPFWETMDGCRASKLEEVQQAVQHASITYNYGPWLSMTPEGRHFIDRCLQRDPAQRMSVDEALGHPWLTRFAAAPRASTTAASSSSITSAHHKAPVMAAAVAAAAGNNILAKVAIGAHAYSSTVSAAA